MTTTTAHKIVVSDRAQRLPATSVWDTFTPLAVKHSAVNLGQGFPTLPAPKCVTEPVKQAIDAGIVQYTRSIGHPRLVKALANYLSPSFGRTIDPMTEIVTTVGATEALLLATLAILNPGDEGSLSVFSVFSFCSLYFDFENKYSNVN